jgi:hypothetical protein
MTVDLCARFVVVCRSRPAAATTRAMVARVPAQALGVGVLQEIFR